MKSITEAQGLNGKRVIVRVDWSVPVQSGKVLNDYSIKRSLPTIEYLREAGAKVILLSHAEDKGDSLLPVFEHVKNFLPLTFGDSSDIVLYENLRLDDREENNSEEYARELAGMGDIFINEAFSVSHRRHASIVGLPKFLPSYIGFEFSDEVKNLSEAFHPPHPFLLILGGAKSETKLPLVEKFINIADHIFIGGAVAREASEMPFAKSSKVIFPIGDISALDSNDETLAMLEEKIINSSMVIWNGPLGKYEIGYREGTLSLAKIISKHSKKSIVGGGDTLAALTELDILDKFSFVSTGGGAMLEFLATETLPGIEVLNVE